MKVTGWAVEVEMILVNEFHLTNGAQNRLSVHPINMTQQLRSSINTAKATMRTGDTLFQLNEHFRTTRTRINNT